ncbi:uncharacterized protein CANTADRAFT_7642 [Suhomyces tanzawaensis NRRL Y-17324]|uniref:Glucosidase 2 subunit beta n=1 Tax=Suhomyces tanzawaensis NRRL Y-17324 TaxID=984487 RepID=A0A1E4SFL8_9ASCO|nr:uncharacterized protein CANTADRAFT_7642 [Suhomyces tanzawaensis NRRL Y-17324]ODV78192.1 hypothetical protein CANTADRAFT_7642 [Suhomyces tanzawaensis NRRL Y-17324]
MYGKLLLFGITLYSALSIASDAQIRGVPPSDQHLYAPVDNNGVKQWHCLGDPSIILSYDQINDDYCDCPDGSDEPGTNACPYNSSRKFYCANKHHIPGFIETFKLNDGTCDYDICCDGSDEYLSGKCENKCEQIHEQFVEYKLRVVSEVEESLKVKNKMIEEARKIKALMVQKISEMNSELKIKEEQIELHIQQQEQGEDEEEEEGEQVYDKLEPYLTELSHRMHAYSQKVKDQESRISYLEKALSKLTQDYNPNFNDAAVKEAVKAFQEYASNLGETTSVADASEILNSLIDSTKDLSFTSQNLGNVVPSFANMAQYYFDQFTKPKNQELPKKKRRSENFDLELESKERDSLRDEIKVYEEDLTKDYGPEGILRASASSWVSGSIGEYKYKLGFLNSIYQDSILIGTYTKYEDNKLYFTNGHKCWNGPYRSAVVELICGAQNKFLNVREPEKCEYYFEVVSPIACEEFTDDDILANFKIDYTNL